MKIVKIAQEWRENPNTAERKLVPVAVTDDNETIRLVQDWPTVMSIVNRIGGAATLNNVIVFRKEYEERTVMLAKISEFEGETITAATPAAPAEKPKRGTK